MKGKKFIYCSLCQRPVVSVRSCLHTSKYQSTTSSVTAGPAMTARIMTRGEESSVECLIKNMVIKLILLRIHIGRRLEPTVHWKGSCDGLKN